MADTEPGWSETEVAGHACHIFEPTRPHEHGYVVMYLHGVHLGFLRDHPNFTEQFERHGLRVIGPVTQRSWWTDKICQEFDPKVTAERHVLDRVVPEIERRWGTKTPQIALLGTSMGGQGALRLAMKHPDTFPIAAAISPAIDYHLRFDEGDETIPLMYADEEAARQDTATLHIHPLYWPRNLWFCCCPTDHRWHTAADRLRMKLGSLGIPFDCEMEREGGGHGFGYYNQMVGEAVDFIMERFERERLRVA